MTDDRYLKKIITFQKERRQRITRPGMTLARKGKTWAAKGKGRKIRQKNGK